jgi:hypothetical protein
MKTVAASLAFAAMLAAYAAAQEPDIVVVGQPLDEAVRAFADEVSAPIVADDQLARWDGELCPGVAGLGQRQAQALIDRVDYRAHQLGLSLGSSGCDANVLIFYTSNSDAFTRGLFERDRTLFGYYYENNINTLGRAALEEFVNTPRAVRSWHVTRRVEASGFAIGSDTTRPKACAGSDPRAAAFANVQIVESQGSRLRQTVRQDFARVIVIIDGRRAQGRTLNAIADYVAMVSLAQLDPGADTRGRPTILNLFDDDASSAATELTAWDLAYLQGVYAMTREAASSREQVSEISARMTDQLDGGN